MILALSSVLVWFFLQVCALARWRGVWLVVAFIPVGVGLGGSFYYCIVRNSNLWPFWGLVVAPFSAAFLIVSWGVYLVTKRDSR